MKLLTLNCHSWQEQNQEEKIVHIVEAIKENSYDVIALQEVNQVFKERTNNGKVKIKSNNFAIAILEELKKRGEDGYSLLWDFCHLYESFEEGVAIITKHPVVEKHSFYVSTIRDFNNWKTRKIVGAIIQYGAQQFTCYSCHMGWWHDKEEPFKAQAEKLFKNINLDKTSFFMGDFNNDAFINNEGYEYLISNGLIDTYYLAKKKDDGVTVKGEIAGWEGNILRKRIDLILTNKPVQVAYSKVIFNNINKPVVSDHFGVEVKIDIP